MVGLAVALFFLYYAAFTAREAAGIAYCQQTVEGINCDTKVILNVQPDPALSSVTHSLPCFFNMVPSSGWQLQFMQNVTYKRLCHTRYDSTGALRKLISSHYSYKVTMDGTPVLWCHSSGHCSADLRLGCHNGGTNDRDCVEIYDNWNAYSSFYIFNHFHFTIGVHSLHQGSLAWEIESVKLTLVGCPAPPCASMSHPEGLLLLRKHDAPFNMVMSYAVEFVEVSPVSTNKPTSVHLLQPGLQSESVWSVVLLVLSTVYTFMLFSFHWKFQLKKRSAQRSKVVEEVGAEPSEMPECDVLLSVMVCGGGRLALTALTVVNAWWLNILPTVQMSFLEPVGLLLYTVFQSSVCGFMSGYASKVILKTPDIEQMVVVVISFLPSTILMFVCITSQLAIFSMASYWGIFWFFILLWVGIDLPLSIWGVLYGISQRTHQLARAAMVWDVQHMGSGWRVMLAVGSAAPFLCILPQLDPILDYLQGINTLTFNFGYALLHFGGMLVTSGLYGFIATGEHVDWHWSSFFGSKFSLLLHLIYVLIYSKAYAGHMLLFLFWAMVMFFSCFLMSGALGFLCASLSIASTV